MKKLNRNQQPKCLSKYNHLTKTWNDVTSKDKKLIWDRLYEMQGYFCAYCESHINKDNHHIEHFAKKSHPQNINLTFNWDNLFGSCNKRNHCGYYKDHGAENYVLQNLIKPDESNPELYLQFTFSGRVQAKEGLSINDLLKADETIRVFNLNNDLLVQSRSNVINSLLDYFKELKCVFEDPDINEQEKLTIITEELQEIASKKANAHQTAVKSVFLKNLLF